MREKYKLIEMVHKNNKLLSGLALGGMFLSEVVLSYKLLDFVINGNLFSAVGVAIPLCLIGWLIYAIDKAGIYEEWTDKKTKEVELIKK